MVACQIPAIARKGALFNVNRFLACEFEEGTAISKGEGDGLKLRSHHPASVFGVQSIK
jgi:hypothetical protein